MTFAAEYMLAPDYRGPDQEQLRAALAKFHPTQRATNYVSGYVDDAGKFHPTQQEKP